MALTQKQENFCLAYVESSNGSEAYKVAYSAGKMKEESIRVEAAKMLADPKIALRVAELRAVCVEKTAITVDDLIKELEEARQAALSAETPQASAATAATMGKAKLLGMDKQIIDMNQRVSGGIDVTTLTYEQKMARIAELDSKLRDGTD